MTRGRLLSGLIPYVGLSGLAVGWVAGFGYAAPFVVSEILHLGLLLATNFQRIAEMSFVPLRLRAPTWTRRAVGLVFAVIGGGLMAVMLGSGISRF